MNCFNFPRDPQQMEERLWALLVAIAFVGFAVMLVGAAVRLAW